MVRLDDCVTECIGPSVSLAPASKAGGLTWPSPAIVRFWIHRDKTEQRLKKSVAYECILHQDNLANERLKLSWVSLVSLNPLRFSVPVTSGSYLWKEILFHSY